MRFVIHKIRRLQKIEITVTQVSQKNPIIFLSVHSCSKAFVCQKILASKCFVWFVRHCAKKFVCQKNLASQYKTVKYKRSTPALSFVRPTDEIDVTGGVKKYLQPYVLHTSKKS
jgi:hypothetical protein